MASTPSASALSAVLRCQGNIWTRNPPAKRPASSAYGLGLAGGALRDSPGERSGSDQASAAEASPHGECVAVLVGRGLTVSYSSFRVGGKVSREVSVLRYPKLSQSPGHAHSAAPALVRELAGRLPGNNTCSKIIHVIKFEKYPAHTRKSALVKDTSVFPARVLKLSVTSPCLVGQIPSFVLNGWSALRSTCLSVTCLVSKILFLNLGEVRRSGSSPDEAPRHLLCQRNEKNSCSQTLQASEQTSSKNNSSSAQKITQEGAD
ncbi:uncharacterized protein LOC134636728 [Pelmatolapia mariae]|uniref:uncharacterized protein LOC134636728 n=1 Tax=Pelmatolapia mariae TaxID=158779 RepID=UPI002FE5A688